MESIKELKNICQRGKREKNFLLMKGYIFHRNISIYITKALLILFPKVKPNSVSLLMIFISLLGCVFLLYSSFIIQITGICLVYFGFILDKVDGEIARYKNIFSLQGVYLDELYHLVIPNFVLIAFLFFVFYNSYFLSLILVFIVFFNLMIRFNRKIALIIYIKNIKKINEGFIKFSKDKSKLIEKIFNSFVFKIFSVVERFDLVIFYIFISILLEKIFGFYVRTEFLIVYFILVLMYFLRWSILNYKGRIEEEIKNLIERGY